MVETAEANGLPWVSDVPLWPFDADTAGIGIIVRDALYRSVGEVLLFVGESATSEGVGAAASLGVQFLDAEGREVVPREARPCDISKINASVSTREPRV